MRRISEERKRQQTYSAFLDACKDRTLFYRDARLPCEFTRLYGRAIVFEKQPIMSFSSAAFLGDIVANLFVFQDFQPCATPPWTLCALYGVGSVCVNFNKELRIQPDSNRSRDGVFVDTGTAPMALAMTEEFWGVMHRTGWKCFNMTGHALVGTHHQPFRPAVHELNAEPGSSTCYDREDIGGNEPLHQYLETLIRNVRHDERRLYATYPQGFPSGINDTVRHLCSVGR